jgi:hypothetical protein
MNWEKKLRIGFTVSGFLLGSSIIGVSKPFYQLKQKLDFSRNVSREFEDQILGSAVLLGVLGGLRVRDPRMAGIAFITFTVGSALCMHNSLIVFHDKKEAPKIMDLSVGVGLGMIGAFIGWKKSPQFIKFKTKNVHTRDSRNYQKRFPQ